MALVSNIQLQPGAVGPPQISTNLKYTVAGLTATDALAVGVVPVSTSGSITVKSANDVRNWFQTTKSDGNVEIYMSNDARPDWALRVAGTADNSFVIANSYGSNCTAQFPAFSIGGAGAVGIGKTGATNTLDIAYKNPASGGIQITETQNNVGIKAIAESASGSIGTSSNHKLGFRVNNTTVAAFNTSTQFGIGTDSPGATLDVRGAAIFNEAGAAVDFRVEGDSDQNLFFVDGSADKVGIGTATPDVKLDVIKNIATAYAGTSDQRSDMGITSRNICETANAFSGVNLITGASNQSDWSINNIWQSNYVGELAFKTRTGASSWKEIMRLTKDAVVICGALTSAGGTGDLGVGVSDPVGVLDIQACSLDAAASPGTVACYGIVMRNSSSTNAGNGIAFANDGGTVVGGSIIHIDKGSDQTGDLAFLTRDTSGNVDEALRITNAQNLGIGTTAPGTSLVISKSCTTAYAACAPNLDNFALSILNTSNHASGGVFAGIHFNQTGDSANRISYIGAITEDTSQNSSLVFGTDDASAGRTEKMRINSDGLVGIGTATPSEKLDVTGGKIENKRDGGGYIHLVRNDSSGGAGESLGIIDFISTDASTGSCGVMARIKGVYDSAGDSAKLQFFTGASTGSGTPTITERLTILSGGNVGIGTCAPRYGLHVQGEVFAGIMPGFGCCGKFYLGRGDAGDSDVRYHYIEGFNCTVASSNYLSFNVHTGASTTSTTEVLRLRGDGNVGIGTAAPVSTSRLHIMGTDGDPSAGHSGDAMVIIENCGQTFLELATGNANHAGLTFSDAGAATRGAVAYDHGTGLGGAADTMYFQTAGSLRVAIDSSGDVGIGTTAPGDKLDVRGGAIAVYGQNTTHAACVLKFGHEGAGVSQIRAYGVDASTMGIIDFVVTASDGTPSCCVMTVTSTGLGIGTTTPVQQLEINGGGCAATIAFRSTTSSANYMLIRKCGSQLEFVDTNNDGTTDREIVMVVDGCGSSAGKVGIGTTTPASELEISSGDGRATLTLDERTAFADNEVRAMISFEGILDTDARGQYAFINAISTAGSYGAGELAFGIRKTSDGGITELIRLADTGHVGIGTTVPSTPLSVFSSGNSYISSCSTGLSAGVKIGSNCGSYTFYAEHDATSLKLYDNNASANRLIIDSSGNFGIGTEGPTTFSGSNAVLTLGGVAGANTELVLASASSGGSVGQISFTCTANTTNQARIYYNQATGDMGVEAADDIYVTGKICKVNNPAFMLRPGGQALNRTGDGTVFCLNGTCVQFDRGSNTSSGIFTAPIAGIYHFQSNIYMEEIDNNHCFVYHNLTTTGTNRFAHGLVQKAACLKAGNGPLSFSNSWIIDMAANDVARITVQVGGGSCVVDFICSTNYLNTFAGYLVG